MEKPLQLIRNSSHIIHDHWEPLATHIYDSILNKKQIRHIIELPEHADIHLPRNTYYPSSIQKIKETSVALGIIGWVIWTAIDNIRDEGKNSSNEIMIFSILRPAIDNILYSSMMSPKMIRNLLNKIGIMEYTNSLWCTPKLKDHYILKSIGVAVPMLVFLIKIKAGKKNIDLCYKYFYHFIGARQLSDDALDWPEDMEKGTRTLVTQWLVEAIGENRSVREYRKAFDTIVAPKVNQTILKHAKSSIRYAQKITCFTSTEFLEKLPRFYEIMVRNSMHEQKNALTI